MSQPTQFRIYNVAQEYKIIEKVGRGTYGTVYKAKNLKTGELVAIKKIQNKDPKAQAQGFPITALRQINLLKSMQHKNVVKLKELITSKPQKRNAYRGSTFLVFEYMDHDLAGLFRHKIKYTQPEIKCLVQQILEGVKYLHDSKILHRDIKSANLLLNNKGEVKIADFGLGRKFRVDCTYTSKVVTLWYRAPELLLGTKLYSEKVDIWSVGCIMAEFLIGEVLFRKDAQYMQIHKIYEVCGGLEQNNFLQAKQFSCYNDLKPPNPPYPKRLIETIRKFNPTVDDITLQFLSSLLSLNPKYRLNCDQALEHEYFKTDPLPCKPADIARLDMEYHEMYREPKPVEKREEQIDYKKPPPKFDNQRQPYGLSRKLSKDMIKDPKDTRMRDNKGDIRDSRDGRDRDSRDARERDFKDIRDIKETSRETRDRQKSNERDGNGFYDRDKKPREKISVERSRSRDPKSRERLDRERTERTDRERTDRQRTDRQRTDRQRNDRERNDRERTDRERVDRERTDRERTDRERTDRERTDRERVDREKNDREKSERDRTQRQRGERQRTDRERNDRIEKDSRQQKQPSERYDRDRNDRDRNDRDKSDRVKDYRDREKSRSRGRHDKDNWSRYRQSERSRSKDKSRSRSRRRDDRYRQRSRDRDYRSKDAPRQRSDERDKAKQPRRDYKDRDYRQNDYKGHKRGYQDDDRNKHDKDRDYYKKYERRYDSEDFRKNDVRDRYDSKRPMQRSPPKKLDKPREDTQRDYRDKGGHWDKYRERSPPRKTKRREDSREHSKTPERSPRDNGNSKKPNLHK